MLGVGGIILFSSWKIFATTEKYILYFDASVEGLNPGDPVRFRGVTVGSVVETLIHHNQVAGDTHMPVIIEVDESLIRKKTDLTINLSDEASFERMLQQGMRGTLQAQNLVTSVLYVELDILPHAPAPTFHQVKKEYKEIPTVPTQIQTLIDKLANLDFTRAMDQLISVLARLDSSLADLKVAEINNGLTKLLASVNQVVRSPDLTNSLDSLHRTLDEYRLLSEKVRARIDPLADGADDTLKEARATLVELRQSLQNVRDLLAPEAPLRRDFSATMDELAEAARSIGALADFLNRNPNALLSGRKTSRTQTVNISKTLLRYVPLALSGLALTGCLNLKPVTDRTRFYVLSAVPAATPGTVGSNGGLAVGISRVDIPAYLLDSRIALRQGATEIKYSEYHRWAERLDKGLQRVLGANLSSLLSSDRVALSAWQRGEVGAEVYLSVQRFECDERGRVVLEARWRIATPGGEETLRAGHSFITRQGPVPLTDPEGAVGALSQALADLSQEIAPAVKSVCASPRLAKPERLP